MATKFIVDTHALIWHLEGRASLGSSARSVLESPDSELILPNGDANNPIMELHLKTVTAVSRGAR